MDIEVLPSGDPGHVVKYPSPSHQPAWTLWIVYKSEFPCQFGVRGSWTRSSAMKHIEDILAFHKVTIPDYFIEYQDVHVVTIKELNVATRETRRHISRIRINGCLSRFYDDEADYYLELDNILGNILSPGLRVGHVLVILGGTMDYPNYTLRLRCFQIGNNVGHNPSQILHFIPKVICPRENLEPYGTFLGSGNYMLCSKVTKKTTLLNFVPFFTYTRQFWTKYLFHNPPAMSPSKQKGQTVWRAQGEVEGWGDNANGDGDDVVDVQHAKTKLPTPNNNSPKPPKSPRHHTLVTPPKIDNKVRDVHSRYRHLRNHSSSSEENGEPKYDG